MSEIESPEPVDSTVALPARRRKNLCGGKGERLAVVAVASHQHDASGDGEDRCGSGRDRGAGRVQPLRCRTAVGTASGASRWISTTMPSTSSGGGSSHVLGLAEEAAQFVELGARGVVERVVEGPALEVVGVALVVVHHGTRLSEDTNLGCRIGFRGHDHHRAASTRCERRPASLRWAQEDDRDFHSSDRHPEPVGDLTVGEALEVGETHDLPLVVRELVECGTRTSNASQVRSNAIGTTVSSTSARGSERVHASRR